EVIGGQAPGERRARRGEEGMARAEPGRDGEREDADRRFGGRVAHEPAASIDPARTQAASEPAAEREPRHEHRQHDRHERRRHAERGHGEPEPDDLVNEAREPRAQEEDEPPGEGRTTSRAGQYHATAIVPSAPRTSRRKSDACARGTAKRLKGLPAPPPRSRGADQLPPSPSCAPEPRKALAV